MPTTPGPAEDPTEFRLPTNVKPIHYDIIIRTDLENLTFYGLLKVTLEVKVDTTKITLNSADLELGKAVVKSGDLKDEQVLFISSTDSAQERVTFEATHVLKAGSRAELKIAYSGKLLDNLEGYYRSSWMNEGKAENYALTQFESTAARRAFPCWDEPLLKATFSIVMISRANTVNLSNMSVQFEKSLEAVVQLPEAEDIITSSDLANITSTIVIAQWKFTKFTTTPPMSTYIVAWANGSFKFLEKTVVMPVSGKTIPLRIYATPDIIHQAQFALDVKASVLPLYEKIFDVAYPLPKLDTLVASDFSAGAMENWGLITGRTSAMLLDPDHADLKAKQNVAATESHEVSHMWFGDITTMEWWDYLYLNEGFATLMGEVIIPGQVFPEWRVNSEFITSNLRQALNIDSKVSSHPIEVKIPDATKVDQIFDALSYAKAASVFRMLSFFVGQEKFLQGVSIYLKKHLYSNTVTRDLWDGISAATGLNIAGLMDNWIKKTGFPVLTITEDVNGIQVRQDRFLETGPAGEEENKTIWNIPLNILSFKNGKPVVDKTQLLNERERSFILDTTKPFKLNAGTNGVYRVLYTSKRLALIAEEASKEESIFSLEDRLGLVYDSMALAMAGFAEIGSSLDLVVQFKNEKEYLVWQSISNSLADIRSTWWEHRQTTDKLDKFCQSLYSPLLQQLGFDYPEDEPIDKALLRTQVIEKAFEAGDERVITELRRRFKVYTDTGDTSAIPADLQRVIYSAATQYGGREEYDFMTNVYDKPKTPTEKQSAMTAMGATQDTSLLAETFKFISNKAKNQDVGTFFAGLASNFKARRLLAKYVQDEYAMLAKRFPGYEIGKLIARSISFFSTEEDHTKVKEFFKHKDTSSYDFPLNQALEGILAKNGSILRSTKDLDEWLSKH